MLFPVYDCRRQTPQPYPCIHRQAPVDSFFAGLAEVICKMNAVMIANQSSLGGDVTNSIIRSRQADTLYNETLSLRQNVW